MAGFGVATNGRVCLATEALQKVDNALTVKFYHCKFSGSPEPGARVDDLYEVCGQAQKSVVWTNKSDRILKKFLSREKRGSKFIRGSMALLKDLFDTTPIKIYEIVVVQPGLAKNKISLFMSETLGATNDHIQSSGCEALAVWASA
jgi:hypothetical protein